MEFVLTKGYIMTLYFIASVHISVHCISKDLIFIEKIHLHSFFYNRKDVMRSVSHSDTGFFETK